MAKRKVTWTKTALQQFNSGIKYIRKTSPQNAETVKDKILDKVNSLEDDIAVHRKDPCKKDNDGSFHYFEILKYRIAYQVRDNEVFIIRVNHTSMEPQLY